MGMQPFFLNLQSFCPDLSLKFTSLSEEKNVIWLILICVSMFSWSISSGRISSPFSLRC